jgi:Mg2+ and Co2+ transporter CorA
MTVVNVIFGITVEVFGRNRSDETAILLIGFTLSLIALIAMCRKTHRRIQLAAAED